MRYDELVLQAAASMDVVDMRDAAIVGGITRTLTCLGGYNAAAVCVAATKHGRDMGVIALDEHVMPDELERLASRFGDAMKAFA